MRTIHRRIKSGTEERRVTLRIRQHYDGMPTTAPVRTRTSVVHITRISRPTH